MSTLLSGRSELSDGIAMAKAYRLDEPILLVERRTIENSEVEVNRFHQMLYKSRTELMLIRENAMQVIGREQVSIFMPICLS